MRIEDAGRKAYIGMGFVERSESFDFSECRRLRTGPHSLLISVDVALQDYTKYVAKLP